MRPPKDAAKSINHRLFKGVPAHLGNAMGRLCFLSILVIGLVMPLSVVSGTTLSAPSGDRLERWLNDVSLAQRDCERALFLADRNSDMRRSQARSIQRMNQWFIQFEQRRIDQLVRQINENDEDSERLQQLATLWETLLECEAELKSLLSG